MENAACMDLSNSESPRFIGRTIAALAGDRADCTSLSDQVCVAAELARKYAIEDVDGASPVPLHLEDA